MANKLHLEFLNQGVTFWNYWRSQNPDIRPDLAGANLNGAALKDYDLNKANLCEALLSEANLSHAELMDADMRWTDLSGACLSRAILIRANLENANLTEADLRNACLEGAKLSGMIAVRADFRDALLNEADLSRARLSAADFKQSSLYRANLTHAKLNMADLSGAELSYSILVKTNLQKATLAGCRIYGISAWDLNLKEAKQDGLVISPWPYQTITVDSVEVAQFIYLILNNEKIREVIDTITSKVVLILGRFTPERKPILDVIRNALHRRNYLPVLFDFGKPSMRDLTETVSTLAHLARFLIVDITDPRSVPQELQAIVPTLAVPVQPVMQASTTEYSMFADFKKYPWVLEIHRYKDISDLLESLDERILNPVEAMITNLRKK